MHLIWNVRDPSALEWIRPRSKKDWPFEEKG